MIRPPRMQRLSLADTSFRLNDLAQTAKVLAGRPRVRHPWFAGRPIAHKLIGQWALNNPDRWLFWAGASPQLKVWNKSIPPIRSIQLDCGLTDEETDKIFRNPKIQSVTELADTIYKVRSAKVKGRITCSDDF